MIKLSTHLWRPGLIYFALLFFFKELFWRAELGFPSLLAKLKLSSACNVAASCTPEVSHPAARLQGLLHKPPTCPHAAPGPPELAVSCPCAAPRAAKLSPSPPDAASHLLLTQHHVPPGTRPILHTGTLLVMRFLLLQAPA